MLLPTIRRASLADVATLTSLVRGLGYLAQPDRIAATLAALLEDPRTCVYMAVSGDDVVGFITISSRPVLRLQGTVGTIEELAVREGCRGQGIGNRLVRYAKGLATERRAGGQHRESACSRRSQICISTRTFCNASNTSFWIRGSISPT